MTPALRLALLFAGLVLTSCGVLVLAPTDVPAIAVMVGYGVGLVSLGGVLVTLAALSRGPRR